MASLLDRARADADRRIAELGQTIVLRRRRSTDPSDEDMPWKPGSSLEIDYELPSLWFDFELRQIDGELVLLGDQLVVIPALTLDDPIVARDRLIRGDEAWYVVRVLPCKPGDLKILTELQVRR